MVYYFTIPEDYLIYMGKDKYENEDLIKYAWKEDIWFHVNDLSSAHVYLRLKSPEERIEDVPKDVIYKCATLTKANSIEGCKKTSVQVIYTPASNLKKTNDMEVGSVSYYNNKLVYKLLEVDKEKELVKEMNKTKTEKYPDLRSEKEQHEMAIEKARMQEVKAEKQKQLMDKKAKEKEDLEFENARHEFFEREPEEYDPEEDFI